MRNQLLPVVAGRADGVVLVAVIVKIVWNYHGIEAWSRYASDGDVIAIFHDSIGLFLFVRLAYGSCRSLTEFLELQLKRKSL